MHGHHKLNERQHTSWCTTLQAAFLIAIVLTLIANSFRSNCAPVVTVVFSMQQTLRFFIFFLHLASSLCRPVGWECHALRPTKSSIGDAEAKHCVEASVPYKTMRRWGMVNAARCMVQGCKCFGAILGACQHVSLTCSFQSFWIYADNSSCNPALWPGNVLWLAHFLTHACMYVIHGTMRWCEYSNSATDEYALSCTRHVLWFTQNITHILYQSLVYPLSLYLGCLRYG